MIGKDSVVDSILWFTSCCAEVDWGDTVKTGNLFSAKAVVLSVGILATISSARHSYVLGPLTPGDYAFHLTACFRTACQDAELPFSATTQVAYGLLTYGPIALYWALLIGFLAFAIYLYLKYGRR